MKNRIHLIYIATILVLGAFIIGIFAKDTSNKVAYINLTEVFEGFDLKKELSIKFEKGAVGRDDILNDMYMRLEQMVKELEKNPDEAAIVDYRKKEAIYMEKKQQFDEQKQKQLAEYDAQILKQLTQYVEDYGEKEGVDVILGATGQGNIMYCNDQLNLTEDVIAYINNRYHGENNE